MSVNVDLINEFLNWVNSIAHQEPYSFLIDGIYWYFLLVVVCPIVGIIKLIRTLYNFFCLYLSGLYHPSIELPSSLLREKNRQLAVVITGCDTGFGRGIAFALLQKGFVVFCGCLHEESFQQYEGEPLAIPLKMDVTSDKEVQQAYETVSTWLSSGESSQEEAHQERYLHALINNAGICFPGLVDWLQMSQFEKTMEVNFFGMVRCVKTFYPIWKRQSSSSSYSDARILNMVSVASMCPMDMSVVSYASSKFAAEAFSNNLRQEMKLFDVKVTTINPGFHKSSMTDSLYNNMKAISQNLPETKRNEYGEEFIEAVVQREIPEPFHGRVVIDGVVKCLLDRNPPAKLLLGIDAKYAFHGLSKFPVWLNHMIIEKLSPVIGRPALMNTSK